MKLSKLTLNLTLAAFLGTAGCAAAASSETDDGTASKPGVEIPVATTEETSAAQTEHVVAGESAPQPASAGDTTESEKKPSCQGFGDCAGQVVKGVLAGVLVLPLIALMVLGGGG